MMWDWRVLRAVALALYWPKLRSPFCLQLPYVSLLSSNGFLLWGWGFRIDSCVREAAFFCSFWIISNTVIYFNLNWCFKMTPIFTRWLVEWFRVLYSVFRRAALLLFEGERGLFDPSPPHWQLVNSLGRLIPDSHLEFAVIVFIPLTIFLFQIMTSSL